MGIDNVMGPDAHDGPVSRRITTDKPEGFKPKATFVDEIDRLIVAAEKGYDLHTWLRALELKREVLEKQGIL